MNESHYYNVLAIAAQGGYATLKKYRAGGGGASWEAAYHAAQKRGEEIPDPKDECEKMVHYGIRIILDTDSTFPESLRHIPHPPLGIYLRGEDLSLRPEKPTLAIVGTRRASAEGKRTTREFASALARAGCAIVSGLAFGIDAAAHAGALDAANNDKNAGATIAVLARGLDAVYPQSHDALARRILAHGGTLVSEYPCGSAPLPYRFIERNRIISGLARGVIIIEAPESSGALATARYALEQNRDLFVVPGAASAACFKGSHALIRQGAELVTTPEDILDAYNIERKPREALRTELSSPEKILILQALTAISTPADVDKLITMTKLEPRIVNQMLSLLIIEGIVKESGLGYTI